MRSGRMKKSRRSLLIEKSQNVAELWSVRLCLRLIGRRRGFGRGFSMPFHRARFGMLAGFTIVELMIVVAVVGVLASLAYPAYQSHRTKALDRAAAIQISAMSGAIS